MDKIQTFAEVALLLPSSFRVIHKAFLEINCCDDGHAVAKKRISYFETFTVDHSNEVDDPGGMGGNKVGGVLEEDLRDHGFEVTETEGEKQRVIEQTKVCVVDYLEKEPWPPVIAIGVEFGKGALGEFGGTETMNVGHPGLEVHFFSENDRTVHVRE